MPNFEPDISSLYLHFSEGSPISRIYSPQLTHPTPRFAAYSDRQLKAGWMLQHRAQTELLMKYMVSGTTALLLDEGDNLSTSPSNFQMV